MLVIATLPPDGPRLLRQGGFETRLYMNPDPSTFIYATRGERLEAAHDFRDGVAPFGLIGQNDYSVHVVGHYNEGVQINAMVVRRRRGWRRRQGKRIDGATSAAGPKAGRPDLGAM